VLIIPSEEYLPAQDPLAGIFQKHQLDALSSYRTDRFGLISIRLVYSLPMILKAGVYRLAHRRVANELGGAEVGELKRLLAQHLFRPASAIRIDRYPSLNILRLNALRFLPPSPMTDHYSWLRGGMVAFKSYVRRFGRPDLIHAHNALNAGLLALKLKGRYGVPYILTEHSSFYYQNLVPRRLYGRIHAAIGGAARYLVVSQALARSLETRLGSLPRPVEVLPNVLPLVFVSPGTRLSGESRSFTFVNVGSLLPVKGHANLLRAFAALVRDYPETRLTLIGDGPLRTDLQSLTQELRIANRVSFLGQLCQEDVRRKMLGADAFIFSSRFETFGVAMIEAMACGLPVIATKCGGPLEIVTSDTGILAERSDPESLVEAMRSVISNQGRFDRERIRTQAISNYGPETFSSRMGAIYESVSDCASRK
jgi:glycosyltransferase involved in cell wall biosynthesis